jgi:hypothetical protein
MEFEWEDLVMPGHDGLTVNLLYAPPGSPGAAVLAYLTEVIALGAGPLGAGPLEG